MQTRHHIHCLQEFPNDTILKIPGELSTVCLLYKQFGLEPQNPSMLFFSSKYYLLCFVCPVTHGHSQVIRESL